MARSIDSINRGQRVHVEATHPPAREPRVGRASAGTGSLALSTFLIVGAFFLATRPSADSNPKPPATNHSPASTAPATVSAANLPGPPQPEQGESVEHAVILDHPLTTSKSQDGNTGSPAATQSPPTETPKPNSFTTRILNGSGQSGQAAIVQAQLTKLGFSITDAGTAVNAYAKSVVYYTVGHELQAKSVQAAFGHSDTSVEQSQIASPADVLLVIGASAVN